MDNTSIDDILNDANEPELTDEPTAEQPVEQPVEQPRDDQGRFAAKGENEERREDVPGPSPVPSEPQLDHAALLGERRRRQEAEARIAELEASFRQPQATAQQQQAIPDMFEEPDAYTAWVKEEAKREAIAEVQAIAKQTTFEARLEVSEMLAREKHADFEEKLSVFADLVQQNPALRGELMRAQNPAEYAYTTAKNYAEVKELGTLDMVALKEKLRAEILAEETAKLPRASAPTKLVNERNVGSRAGPSWSGPKPLSELLG